MWKLIAWAMGYRDYYDTVDNTLVVYREGDTVHFHSWKEAVLYCG